MGTLSVVVDSDDKSLLQRSLEFELSPTIETIPTF
jgi:hypothetical protein